MTSPGPIKRCTQWLAGERLHHPFLKAVGAVAVVRLSGGLLLFLSQVLFAAWMGTEAFGVYSYAWAWVAVLSTIAGVGFSSTSVRFLATYRAQSAYSFMRGLLRFGRALTLASSLAIMLCGLVATLFMDPNSPYLGALRVSFLAIPALALLWLEAAYARGCNWMTLSVLAEQIARPIVLITLGGALFIAAIGNANAYVIACVAAYFIAAGGQHVAVRARLRTELEDGPSRRDVRAWLGVAVAMLLLNGAQMIRLNTDLLFVGWFLEPRDVGIYTAAVRTSTLVAFVMTVTSIVAQPDLAAMHAEKRQADLERFVSAASRSIFIASLAIGTLLGVFGYWVLERFGAEFVAAYPAMMILVVAHVLVAGSGPMTSLLIMTGHQKAAATIVVGSALSAGILGAALIPPLGILGAALATGANLLAAQVALWVAVKRRLGLSVAPFGK
jgi:O-antigen/teichoic acid export membrane protein